jgi:glucose/arabinose dehydrogenase
MKCISRFGPLAVIVCAVVTVGLPACTSPTTSTTTSTSVTTLTNTSTAPTPATTTTGTAATTSPPVAIPAGSIRVERVFPNLSFEDMTNLVEPDDSIGQMFISEQKGIIQSFEAGRPEQGSHVFLDITDRVNRGGNEEGLLGLAFDPDYQGNGYFYVYYSAAGPRRSVVSRFSRDPANPGAADPRSEVVVMEIAQPYANHNGGQLAFGPDGYLYIGLGDGGGGGDPQGNGQNLGTLLGKVLRIDVRGLTAAGAYKIPADNPFVDTAGARAEIWACGLRNPWRFSFDVDTGLLWAGDVGQDKWEEIDIITGGANYGWNIMEGNHCYSPASGCDRLGLILPIVEYDHSQGCSVTGGYVYRGNKIPDLQGRYIYGDFCTGKIWVLDYQGTTLIGNELLVDSGLSITSFGVDPAGNLYILSRDGGVYTLVQS